MIVMIPDPDAPPETGAQLTFENGSRASVTTTGPSSIRNTVSSTLPSYSQSEAASSSMDIDKKPDIKPKIDMSSRVAASKERKQRPTAPNFAPAYLKSASMKARRSEMI